MSSMIISLAPLLPPRLLAEHQTPALPISSTGSKAQLITSSRTTNNFAAFLTPPPRNGLLASDYDNKFRAKRKLFFLAQPDFRVGKYS
jgi:hypothetical protein